MAEGLLIFYQYPSKIWPLLENTGLVARVVLLILLIFSVLSWAVIIHKSRQFNAAQRQSREFLNIFRHSKKLTEIRNSAQNLKATPLVEVFLTGYRELESQVVVSENPGKPHIRSLEAVHRSLQIASSAELTRMEQRLTLLATTGAVTPFVGLFGTVWGIIDAFQGLGNAGTATFTSVAPGIAEALITTAAGLFAAIPAVIAYNHLVQRLKEFGTRMDDFALEFLNLVERHFA